jgi:hypothetical protein
MKFTFFLIFIFNILFINAQQIKVKGTVIDKETNLPICNVSVYDKKSNIGTLTKKDGTFCLELNSNYIILNLEEKKYNHQELNLFLKRDTILSISLTRHNKPNLDILKLIKK